MTPTLADFLSLAQTTTAWLLTYTVHSTLFLAAAWALSSRWSLPARELAWKTALVGGLITASLQLASPWKPALGTWSLGGEPALAASPIAEESGSLLAGGTPLPNSATIEVPPEATPVSRSSPTTLLASPSKSLLEAQVAPQGAPARTSLENWSAVVSAVWLTLAALGLGALAISYRRLRQRLADRRPIPEGSLAGLFQQLRERFLQRRRVELLQSRALQIPIARGVVRAEICVPEKALQLSRDEQESLLAHEMAHVARRDPAWLLLSRTLERLFFFQPLNRLARRQLQEIAEYRCDDWAAATTGRPLSLARCLTEVAQWNLRHPQSFPAPSMAAGGSALRRRVQRLVTASRQAPGLSEHGSRWLAVYTAFVVMAVAFTVPGFTRPAGDSAPSTETVSEAPTAPTAPEAPEAPKAAPTPARAPSPLPTPVSVSASLDSSATAPSASSAPTAPAAPAKASRPDRAATSASPPVKIPEIHVPAVRVPSVRVPATQVSPIQVPEVRVPAVQVPAIRVPKMTFTTPEGEEVEIPEINIPEIEIPEIHLEAFDTPIIEIPEIHIPEIHIPEIHIPEMEIPEGLSEEEMEELAENLERHLASIEPQMAEKLALAEEHLQRAVEEAQRAAEQAHEESARALEERVRSDVERQDQQNQVRKEAAERDARQAEERARALEERARSNVERQRRRNQERSESAEKQRVKAEERARVAAQRSREAQHRQQERQQESQERAEEQQERAEEQQERARVEAERTRQNRREERRQRERTERPSANEKGQTREQALRQEAELQLRLGLELEEIQRQLKAAKQQQKSTAQELRRAKQELRTKNNGQQELHKAPQDLAGVQERERRAKARLRELKQAYFAHPLYPPKHNWGNSSLPDDHRSYF
ncbi:MAG: hypothetical protein K0U98_02625 [Deltaproteobacteria bacterium]|nr:hypothetical protein [Deltaproteobacteria bacterium]